jgi:surface antigen
MHNCKCIHLVSTVAILLACFESNLSAAPLSFSPASATAGSSVTISGGNFSAAPASNLVYFGAVQAAVVAASATSLTVTVPACATYAPITVTVNGLTASSGQPFLPAFVGSGLGLSASSFGPLLTLSAGSQPVRVIIADLDGDGKPDLIVGNSVDHTIGLYRNISTNGTLTAASFALPVLLAAPSGTDTPRGLTVADVDGDGKLDIIVADSGNNTVSVYHNNCTPGSITSNAFATRVDFATGAQPMDVAVVDIDGDGKPDLVVANYTDGTVSILRNTGVMGSLTSNSFAPKVDFATGSGCWSVSAGDLDGDGKPDLAAANNGSSTVSVLRNLSTPGNIAFAPAANLAVLGGAVQVSIGDLDGDGKPDLAVACYLSSTLSVFRNLSTVGSLTTNSFAARIDFPLAGRGHATAIADFDGDGKPDIAVVTELNSMLSIFRNVSTPGSFTSSSLAARVDLATGNNAWGVSVGDLDGDGRPDVVFCNQYGNSISIYQNLTPFGITTGAPMVIQQPASQTAAPGTQVAFSASANGSPSTLQWYFGTNAVAGPSGTASPLAVTASDETAGNYTAVFSNSYGTATSAVAVLTVIDPPLITTPPASLTNLAGTTATFSVTASGTVPLQYQWRKNGLGLMDGGHVSGSATATLTLTNVSLADMGSYDVVVTNPAGSATSSAANLTVLARPYITLQPASVSDFAGTTATFTVAAAGTATLGYHWLKNNAGLTDGGNVSGSTTPTLTLTNLSQSDAGTYAVLVANSIGSILSSNAVLTVTAAPVVPVIFSFSPCIAAAGANVIISGTNFNPVPAENIVYFGAVEAMVASATETNLEVAVPVSATYAPITVTVNGLTASSGQPFLPAFAGNGLGLSASSFGPLLTLSAGNQPVRVIIADLDGDGKPDLIVGNSVDHTIGLYRNISTNGTLTAASFALPVLLAAPSGTDTPRGLTVADVDGDGKLDIIVADSGNNTVSVYHNNCTPGSITSNAFATRVDFATGAQPMDVAVVDIDGDGKPDLVVANYTDGTVSILRNTGVMGSLTSNSFAPKVDFATGSGCWSVSAGDLDGDGKPDLAAANNGSSTVSVLRNLSTPGNIAFAPAANLAVLGGAVQVSIGDLDGDGKPDLAVACYLSSTLSVFRNLSTVGSLTTNSFAARIDFPLAGRGHATAIADFDGDGKPDIAVVTELNSTLSIFRNASTPGSFTSNSLAARVDLATGNDAWGVSVGDLDGDGRPDVVFCNQYDNTISIYQNLVPFAAPPTIATQPANQTVGAGGSALFTVVAGGSPPFSYQWRFDGTNIPGASSNSLTVAAVQMANAGTYSVMVSNSVGWIASSNAVLALASTLQVASVSTAGAGFVTVPVILLATGNESALGFSLDFDSTVLTYTGVAIGSGASGAFMFVNTNQAAGGRIGLDVAFFGGAFSPGAQEIVDVTFQAALVTNTVATSVSFGDVPTPRQISDVLANTIPGTYLAGTVTVLPTSLEGDVWPRTNGDHMLTVNDWVQEGRFVAGLDMISNISEFQRADCAPRETLGDGYITVIDWIQVGRYVAGLDPLTPAGGPTGPPPAPTIAAFRAGGFSPLDSLSRTISITPLTPGATSGSAMVELAAQGDESAVQFSVDFDPTAISFVSASLGAGAAGAVLFANTTNLAAGQLGIALCLPSPNTFAAGTQPIVKLNFNSSSYSNTASLVFADSPLVRQVGDNTATAVSATYLNGSLVVGGAPWPPLAISQSSGNIILSWPASAGSFGAQKTTVLGGSWTGAGGTPVTNGATVFLALPAPTNTTFFRLSQP